MARIDNLTNFLTDVSTAIKTKRGDNTPISAENFDTEITNLPGADMDWTELGYKASTPQIIVDSFNYAKQIKDNWDTTVTEYWSTYYNDRDLMFFPKVDTSNAVNFNSVFKGCSKLIYVPELNLSNAQDLGSAFNSCPALTVIPKLHLEKCTNLYMLAATDYSLKTIEEMDTHLVTNFYRAFYNCTSLENVPVFDFSSASVATDLGDIFYGCAKLTDQSVDNILQACITATSYQGSKRFATLGFNNSRVSSARVQACPHYQDFLDAGWVIGY